MELQINISGKARSGRSTMSELIKMLLEKEGFDCSIIQNEYKEGTLGNFELRKEAIKDRKVVITSTQLAKEGFYESN